MTISLYQFLKQLKKTFVAQDTSLNVFNLEFSPSNEERLKAHHISGILVTPYLSNDCIGFILENKLSFVLKAEQLPFSKIEKGLLWDNEYELIRSLAINNISTANISEEWLFDAGFQYFLHTLGVNFLNTEQVTLTKNEIATVFSISPVSFDEFLQTINHLTKNWFALSTRDESAKLVIEKPWRSLTEEDLIILKDEGVHTLISFNLNSHKYKTYKKEKINLIYMNHIDYLNILLRKVAQSIQLDLTIPALFYPQRPLKLKTPYDYEKY